jgi:hypothetical protein
MLKKILTVAAFGVLASGSLVLAGCSTTQPAKSDQPYALTGRNEQDPTRDPKNYDSKGHYRPDFAVGFGNER